MLHFPKHQLLIPGAEDPGNVDLHGTTVDTVPAGGTGDGIDTRQHLLNLGDDLPLIVRKGLKVLHVRDVVLHLFQIGHAGENGQYPIQRGGKPHRPGSGRCLGVRFGQDLPDLGDGVGQRTALYRLHDDHRLIMLPGHLIAGPGCHTGAFPVGIVDLQLNKLGVRMLGQQLFQQLGTVVKREAPVLDMPLPLLFLYKVPNVILFIFPDVSFADGMEQIVIKIPCPRPLQAGVQLLPGLLHCGRHPGVELCGQGKLLPGIPVHQGGLCRLLRLAVVIDVGGIKVSKPGLHEQIHHLFDLLNVDFPRLQLWQPHQSKAQLGGVFTQILFHDMLLLCFGPPNRFGGPFLPFSYSLYFL